MITRVVLLFALAALAGAVCQGCAGGAVVTPVADIAIEYYLDAMGVRVDAGNIDPYNVPANIGVKLGSPSYPSARFAIIAANKREDMTHADLPTTPTAGGVGWLAGFPYVYYGNGWGPASYFSAPVIALPGRVAIDGQNVVRYVGEDDWTGVGIGAYVGNVLGSAVGLGFSRSATTNIEISFPPTTTVEVGVIYIIFDGYVDWRLPGTGVPLYIDHGGQTYMVGVLQMINDKLSVVFNLNLAMLAATIPAGQSQTFQVYFNWQGQRYTFNVTLQGAGGGGDDDSLPPTVVVSGVVNGQTVSGLRTVTVTMADNEALAFGQLLIDNIPVQTWTLTGTNEVRGVPWTTNGYANGSHTISATVSDAGGNVASSTPITVNVQNANGGTGGIGVVIESLKVVDLTM